VKNSAIAKIRGNKIKSRRKGIVHRDLIDFEMLFFAITASKQGLRLFTLKITLLEEYWRKAK